PGASLQTNVDDTPVVQGATMVGGGGTLSINPSAIIVPDLGITKDDGVTQVNVGTSTTYTITLTNNGPDPEPAGVVISDPIPAGTTGSTNDANCQVTNNGTGSFTCTTTATLAVNASVTYHLTLAIPSGYAGNSLVNTVTITSTPVTDPNGSNNSAT